jgi:hypothetical protein
MIAEYSVNVAGKNHRILVQVSMVRSKKELDEVERFAISTALLVHYGYLPAGVINALD